jgi:hypothetical protein
VTAEQFRNREDARREREVVALERQAAIARAHFELVLEDRAKQAQAFESGEAVKRMALLEQERRALAAERWEARQAERDAQGKRMLELLERSQLRAEDEHELRKLAAGMRAPENVEEFLRQTVPPDDDAGEAS